MLIQQHRVQNVTQHPKISQLYMYMCWESPKKCKSKSCGVWRRLLLPSSGSWPLVWNKTKMRLINSAHGLCTLLLLLGARSIYADRPGGVSLELHPCALNGNLTMLIRSASRRLHPVTVTNGRRKVMSCDANKSDCAARARNPNMLFAHPITYTQNVFNFLVTQRGYASIDPRVTSGLLLCIAASSNFLALPKRHPKRCVKCFQNTRERKQFIFSIVI